MQRHRHCYLGLVANATLRLAHGNHEAALALMHLGSWECFNSLKQGMMGAGSCKRFFSKDAGYSLSFLCFLLTRLWIISKNQARQVRFQSPACNPEEAKPILYFYHHFSPLSPEITVH